MELFEPTDEVAEPRDDEDMEALCESCGWYEYGGCNAPGKCISKGSEIIK